MRAISGAKITPTSVSRPSPTSARPSSPLASRSASSSSPRSSNVTNDGTSTADSAPAATSSNSTLDTELAAWNVLPRNVVPSTAATTSTRTKPNARDTAVTAPIRVAAPVHDCPGAPLRRFTLTNAPSRVLLRRGQARRRAVAVAVVPDGARAQILRARGPRRPGPAPARGRRPSTRPTRGCRSCAPSPPRRRASVRRCRPAGRRPRPRPSARSAFTRACAVSTVRSVPAKSLWVPVISSARAGVGGNVVMSALPGSIEMKPASESRCRRSGPGGSPGTGATGGEVSRNASASSARWRTEFAPPQEVGGIAQRLDVAVVARASTCSRATRSRVRPRPAARTSVIVSFTSPPLTPRSASTATGTR